MKIVLSPQRLYDTLTLFRSGSVRTVNDEDLDFSPLAEGDMLPRAAINCEWFAGDLERVGGELC